VKHLDDDERERIEEEEDRLKAEAFDKYWSTRKAVESTPVFQHAKKERLSPTETERAAQDHCRIYVEKYILEKSLPEGAENIPIDIPHIEQPELESTKWNKDDVIIPKFRWLGNACEYRDFPKGSWEANMLQQPCTIRKTPF